jgi:hypothetical protein
MITGNIAAHFLDNPFFKEFIDKLRPSYKLPSRNSKFSKVLVLDEFKRVQEAVEKASYSTDFLAISSDGWSDVTGNRLINVLVHTLKPYLFNTIDATKEVHEGQFICNILKTEIEKLGKSINSLNASNFFKI